MITKAYSAALLAGILLGASAALAQTAWVEIDDDDRPVDIVVEPPTYTVDDIEDMTVVGSDDETIGEVEEVLMSSDGATMAIATEVGGFLGVGQRQVIIPLTDARVVDERIVLGLTREQIEALNEWDEDAAAGQQGAGAQEPDGQASDQQDTAQ